MTVRIGIAGIRGRMGREIATLAANDDWLILVGGLSRHARAAGSVSDTCGCSRMRQSCCRKSTC